MSRALFFDEHVQVLLAQILESHGFDILTARDAGRAGQGISDEDQLRFASSTGRALVSYNTRDFIQIALEWQRSGRQHSGIILSPQRTVGEQLPRFLALFELYPDGFPPNLCMQLPSRAA